ncbi:hypothetical protein [Leptolyngbya sp. BC1307]|nr:hypothetical protein [Leptolyngbya sp. BC1307]
MNRPSPSLVYRSVRTNKDCAAFALTGRSPSPTYRYIPLKPHLVQY